jgi:hypothetical protein
VDSVNRVNRLDVVDMRSTGDFVGTAAKALIRQTWDGAILAAAQRKMGHRLSYFGLPGPNIEDLVDWCDLLGTKTGVERLRDGAHHAADLERIRRLHTNICARDVEDFQLLQGDVESIILDGLDHNGYSPICNDGRPLPHMRFQYDLVNLDFFGGVGYPNRHGESRRVRALKKLFERQQGSHFILLLTVNVRDGLEDELTEYLEQTRDRSEGLILRVADWYAQRQKDERGEKMYKLKAVVPLFVHRMAETWMFRCRTYPPLAYEGRSATMVHFVFDLEPVPGNLRAFSEQSDGDLLLLPLIVGSDHGLSVAHKQHPGFDQELCARSLDFLPPDAKQQVMGTLAGVVAS